MRRGYLAWGAILSVSGIGVMAITASSTYEDVHYDDFGSAMTALAGVIGGGLLLLGLGPLTLSLLGLLGWWAGRLPLLLRLAARDVAGDPVRTAPAVAATVIATALAVALMIIEPALAAQRRAEYYPEARPDALVVDGFPADKAAAVRAAVQRELPGIPIAQRDRQLDFAHLNIEFVESSSLDPYGWLPPQIGDQALLRYLTGDPSTPYAENTAVVVTTENVKADSVVIYYDLSDKEDSLSTRTVPAITVRPVGPYVDGIFVPAKIVRDLGFHLGPEQLIIDPSFHRSSAIEQERLDRRLADSASTYLERGFVAPTGWLRFVVVAALVALGGALAASGLAGGDSRSRRVLVRVRGSGAAMRLVVACRAWLSAAGGMVLGGAAGCAIGLLLVWPFTTSSSWEPYERAAFDTPWWPIAALVGGLPVLAAAIAALPPPGPRQRSRT
ncbi:hypothetical protein Aple_035770 [Acrocarpospora pleiomorpha]|uniref:ABC3 transporter permease protein domain-containing protein n=1 Tax=Acrocarpospora pleiomorpha TaxID=90975 RepID=A0A5M3XM13_9ACTN|nr:hypothetical protein Aple_035770 [Acrocarpospora pleiomorpha]